MDTDFHATTAKLSKGMFVNVASGPKNAAPDYKWKTNQILLIVRILGAKAVLAVSPTIGGSDTGVLQTLQLGLDKLIVVDEWLDAELLRSMTVEMHEFTTTIAIGERKAWSPAIYATAARTVAMLLDLIEPDDRPVLRQIQPEGGTGHRLVAVRPDALAEEIADQVIRMAGKRLALAIVQMANDQRNGR